MNLFVNEFGMRTSIAEQNVQHYVLYRLVVKETYLRKADKYKKNNFNKETTHAITYLKHKFATTYFTHIQQTKYLHAIIQYEAPLRYDR